MPRSILLHRLRVPFALSLILSATDVAFGQTQQHAWYSVTGLQPNTLNTVSGSVFLTLTGGADNNLATASDNLLIAAIADTTNPYSRNRGDLLNVLLFNLSNSVTVTTANGASNVTTALYGSASVVNSANLTVPSQAVSGSWVFGTQTDPDNRFKYGISAAGFSNPTSTGNETYAFSGFTRGNGGDDYALLPDTATRDASNRYVNGGNIVLIKGRVKVTVSGVGLTNLNQITRLGFGYQSGVGANGYAILDGQQVTIPEPATGLLALLGLPLLRRRRR